MAKLVERNNQEILTFKHLLDIIISGHYEPHKKAIRISLSSLWPRQKHLLHYYSDSKIHYPNKRAPTG